MPHRRGLFSYQEAERKLGKVEEACFDVEDIPAGTIGKVVRIEPSISGYSLVVEWNYKMVPLRERWPLENHFGFYTYATYLREL